MSPPHMTGIDRDVPPPTASGPGVPYAEWPATLGDPRWHGTDHDDGTRGTAKSRREIVAQFRRRRPELHAPVAAKTQLARARTIEKSTFPTRLCSFEVHCRRGHATKQCHHCIQFDPQQRGFYCDACFAARHPSYRMAHAWTPLQEVVDPDQSWMTHLVYHNLEQDAQELQLLLAQTQSFLQSHSSPTTAMSRPNTRHSSVAHTSVAVGEDPLAHLRTPSGQLDFQRVRESVTRIATTLKGLVQQVQTELTKKPLTREDALVKIQTMWRLRKARKQLRELLQSVYQAFTDPTTGQTYYYNARTKEAKWTKPRALAHDALVPSGEPSSNQQAERGTANKTPRAKRGRLAALGNDDARRAYAAQCIQGMARTHAARRHFCALISSVYEKIWDDAAGRFYYHNTTADTVTWQRPRWVNDDALPTPRTRDAREAHAAKQKQQQQLAALRASMTVDDAARRVQRAFRRRRGFRQLLVLCRSVYERIYDVDAGRYYYHNTRTQQVTWDKPVLLRTAQADVHAQSLLASAISTRPKRPDWTDETAAVRLQGLFRQRQARRELAVRLANAYKKVWDPSSERFYYANFRTGAVSWEPPAIFQRACVGDVDELH